MIHKKIGIITFFIAIFMLAGCSQKMEDLNTNSVPQMENDQKGTDTNETDQQNEDPVSQNTDHPQNNINVEVQNNIPTDAPLTLIQTVQSESQTKQDFKQVSFEDNYVSSCKTIELSAHIGTEFNNLLGVWEDKLYYIYFKDNGLTLYKINYLDKNAEPEVVYNLDEGTVWYYMSMIKDKIYLQVCLYEKMKFTFWINEISLDGQVQEIYPRTIALKAPIIYDIPGYLIVNYWTGEHCIMEAICLEDPCFRKLIAKKELISKDAKMSGEFITYGGSLDAGGLYYESVILQNEELDSGGASIIRHYDFETDQTVGVLRPEGKSAFLTGNEDCMVRCIYAYNFPLEVSGEYHQLRDKKVKFQLPELYTTNNLIWLKQSDDGYAVGYTGKDILILDGDKMQKAVHTILDEENKDKRKTKVILMENKLYYILYDQEKGDKTLYIMDLAHENNDMDSQSYWEDRIRISVDFKRPVVLDINTSNEDWPYQTMGHFIHVSGYTRNTLELEKVRITDPLGPGFGNQWYSVDTLYNIKN